MCFKCGEKWNKDHRCRTRKVFMIIDSSESDDDVVSDGEATSDEGELRVAELGENNCEAELSLNAMSGVSKPSTMRLMAWVGKFEVSMLVDSGSSHNFINANIVRKIGLRGAAIEPFDVKMANGEKLKCEEVVHEVKMNVQGVRIAADLHALSLVGVDVVLGNTWLKSINDDAGLMALSGAEWRVWDRTKEAMQFDARAVEIRKKLENHEGGVKTFRYKNGLLYYKNYVYVPGVPGLREEILAHFHNSKEGVFHVTILKKRVGNPSLISSDLPTFDTKGNMLLQPTIALRYRNWKKGRGMTKVWQVLVQWQGVPREEATWEDYDEMVERFPDFSLEDKGSFEEWGNVETVIKSKRIGEKLAFLGGSEQATDKQEVGAIDMT
ncbi:hypothetical protein LWI29_015937 [Acer saccharum]|uniref:Chromo domain-containing protein n=1 Tax=Acer saccharum TaxID=4024 RepID=A0AA39VRV9_ACESA|nr:hypothetical protein LWI29_015937 [Acer saccharum]